MIELLMIDLSSLLERYPIRETIKPPENPANEQYFNQGRELALLVKTPEGLNIVEQVKLVIGQVVETERTPLKPKTATVPDDDLSSKSSAFEDRQDQLAHWQQENQSITQSLLTGHHELNNIQQRLFLKIQNPDWNEGLTTLTDQQTASIELLRQFCRSYDFALDYQQREHTQNSLRLPMPEPGSVILGFDRTDINHVRETFKQGWQSVPEIVDIQAK